MDTVSAKVCGTIAIIFGVIFLVTSAVRLVRPDLDVVLVLLNSALGLLAVYSGIRLWRYARRKTKAEDEGVR